MLHRYLFGLLFFLLPFSGLLPLSAACAQGLPGYVLTLTGDTLRGMLAEMPQQRQVHLLGPDGQLRQFNPTQIRGYGLRDQALIASAVVRRANGGMARYFVLPQLPGPASLYSFADETGLLLQPVATDTLYELSALNWHLLFNRYLGACAALSMSDEQVLRRPFEERYVTQLLARYNRCVLPGWQPEAGGKRSVYRQGLGLEADFSYARSADSYNDQPGSGTSQRLILVWSFLRASGLQTDLGLGYSRLNFRTKFFPTTSYNTGQPLPLAEKLHEQLHMLTGLMRVSQRLGKPGRASLLLGVELGANLSLRNSGQRYQRPLAGGGPVVLAEQYDYGVGGTAVHLGASAGVALPLGTRQEVRLSGFYQRYLPSANVHAAGVRAAYTLFRN